jgi:hypothetical protein
MNTPDPSQVVERLALLRAAMRQQQIDALMIPSADPHLSEYLPERWQGREWASGFTGSVGTLIVTPEFAGVWTDARYWTQAEQQLAGTGIQLMKLTSGASVQYVDWLASHLKSGQTLAVDGAVLGLAIARLLQTALDAKDVKLRTDLDLLDQVWQDRPALPDAPIYEHLPPYASKSRSGKLADLRAAMQQAGANRHLISTLDDIAYLFNLRGADVNFNPIFLSHALIPPPAPLYMSPTARFRPNCAPRWRTKASTWRRTPRLPPRWPPAGRRRRAARPAPHHLRHPPVDSGQGQSHRSHQPDHAGQVAQERAGRGPRARHDGTGRRRPVRILRLAGTDPGQREPRAADRAGHRQANHRRPRARPASSARALPPSPASAPTARSCTTAPPKRATPSSKAMACC